jgi:DNA-binding MarR family transcriptional regulator
MLPTPTPDDYRRAAELRATLRLFSRRSEQVSRDEGLTPRRYLLLLMIKGSVDGNQRSTVTELAGRLQLRQSTVTELVGRAEDAGLVERLQSEHDGRVTYLRLTEQGEERLEAAFVRLGPERKRLANLLAILEGEAEGATTA